MTEQDTEAAGRLPRRPGDATVPADMCFRCHGENETAWSVCRACAIAEVRLAVSMAVSDEMSVRTDRVESVLVALDSATERASAATGKQAFAQMEADEMRRRQRTSNDLARQLADRTDELNTLRGQYEDLKDLCSDHSAELAATQVRLEDADAAVKRIGDQLVWRVEAAKEDRADRDRLAARVAELEGERDATARLAYERWHSIAASIRNLSAHANGYEREAKNATTSDADEGSHEPDSLGRCRDCYGRGDDFEGGTCPTCGGSGTKASKPTPACGPTPNALVCACGGPINHAEARE